MAEITGKKSLNPPRRDRTYPRVVEGARHNSYRVKRPGDHGTCHHQAGQPPPALTRSLINFG